MDSCNPPHLRGRIAPLFGQHGIQMQRSGIADRWVHRRCPVPCETRPVQYRDTSRTPCWCGWHCHDNGDKHLSFLRPVKLMFAGKMRALHPQAHLFFDFFEDEILYRVQLVGVIATLGLTGTPIIELDINCMAFVMQDIFGDLILALCSSHHSHASHCRRVQRGSSRRDCQGQGVRYDCQDRGVE